jgi:hypothetical protein
MTSIVLSFGTAGLVYMTTAVGFSFSMTRTSDTATKMVVIPTCVTQQQHDMLPYHVHQQCGQILVPGRPAVSLQYEVYKVFKNHKMHPKLSPWSEPSKEKVVDSIVFSSQTGECERREFVPGRFGPDHLQNVVTMASC